jgi:hypothetical protein
MSTTTWPEGHIKSTDSIFNWRSPVKELTRLEKERACQCADWAKKTAAEKTAVSLVVNKHSDIATSTVGAGLRSDQIRRGGK